MSRTLTAGVIAELAAGTVRPVLLAEGEFTSGFLRLWSGLGELSWDGKTWTGAGNLLSVAPAPETAGVRAQGVAVTLTGIKNSYLALALGQINRNKPLRCWLGFLTTAGAVIADPAKIFEGRMDGAEIAEGAVTATIAVLGESRLADLRRPRLRRYAPEDQKKEFPGDKFFDFVPLLANRQVVWGAGYPLSRIRTSYPSYEDTQHGQ